MVETSGGVKSESSSAWAPGQQQKGTRTHKHPLTNLVAVARGARKVVAASDVVGAEPLLDAAAAPDAAHRGKVGPLVGVVLAEARRERAVQVA